ncbi:hypothetical protein [Microcoleus sp. OTE_8_concoct_300]|uniref:hypothetical protein n=1 Tax=Microcoleus sp. OTE_8_concoct_300 TaxID=2964710 RepID=UPI00403EF7E8
MNLTQTAPTIDTAAPATFTCAQCPFARLIEDNRYCCQVSQTASDVKRGHWEATVSCFEALAKAEAEKATTPAAAEVEAPIAKTDAPAPAPATPATASHTATAAPTPAAIGENDEPPNRGDNGRGRVQPIAAKKLMPSLVAIKRITSDIPASNFDQFELEVLGELSLSIGGFVVPPVLVRDSGGYRVVSGHLQFHAAVLAKQLNPRAGETIPAIVLESENQTTASAMLKMLKFAA